MSIVTVTLSSLKFNNIIISVGNANNVLKCCTISHAIFFDHIFFPLVLGSTGIELCDLYINKTTFTVHYYTFHLFLKKIFDSSDLFYLISPIIHFRTPLKL